MKSGGWKVEGASRAWRWRSYLKTVDKSSLSLVEHALALYVPRV